MSLFKWFLQMFCLIGGSFVIRYSEGVIEDQYVGCYYDNVSRSNWTNAWTNNSNLSIEQCISKCRSYSRTFAVLQDGRNCLCGDSFNASLSNNSCNIPCSGNSTVYCGGLDKDLSYGVFYAVCPIGYYGTDCRKICHCKDQLPCNLTNGACPDGCDGNWTGDSCNVESTFVGRYIGCYRDTYTRALSDETRIPYTTNPTLWCSNTCATKESTYAGLQWRYQCFCGEKYDTYGKLNDTFCSEDCESNRSQKCGGSYANSVYSVCSAGRFGSDCLKLCNCANISTCNILNGKCESCRAGWWGESCNMRNCSDNNGDCSLPNQVCASVNLSYASTNQCVCKPGYGRDKLWTDCRDLNECAFDTSPCDNATETCQNTIGSYNCVCNAGLQRNNSNGPCSDIDECSLSKDDCSLEAENCNNTFGSFKCECRKGYQRDVNNSNCAAISLVNPSTNHEAGKIAGAVIGSILGLVVIVGIVLLLLYIDRRRRKNDTLINRATRQVQTMSEQQEQDTFMRRKNVQSIFAGGSSQTPSIKALQTVRDKLSDQKTMQEEFQNVPFRTKDFSILGSKEELKKKNRFMNIIPYDWNRVVLSRNTDDDMSEYINASYVQGYNESDKFIAAQGPRTESLDDFWRMIVEKSIPLIVMITNLVDNEKIKCAQYWPNLGATAKFGDVSVTLLEEDAYPSYTTRRLKATMRSVSMKITQYHYVAWPDHGVPKDVKCFLNFHAKVRQQMSPDNYTLVHCSAGVGRTGAFIATDYLLEQEKMERDVDVLECLKALRNQRPAMIQNLRQYEFVHLALLKAFLIGNTSIPIEKIPSKYQSWRKIDKSSEKSMLEIQFQDIEDTKIDIEEEEKYLVSSKAVEKSRLKEINAALIYSWKRTDAFIWTKLLDDSESFWILRKEKNSRVVIFIDSTESSAGGFLPSPDRSISLKCSALSLESETKDSFGWRYVVTESSETEENNYANVEQETIYQNAEVRSSKTRISVIRIHEPNGKLLMNSESFLSLFKFIESVRSEFGELTPIMVTSRCDCSVAGFLITVLNSIEMIKLEQEIDLYQIVLNIRKSKSEFFCSMSSYEDLHDLIERYIQMSAA